MTHSTTGRRVTAMFAAAALLLAGAVAASPAVAAETPIAFADSDLHKRVNEVLGSDRRYFDPVYPSEAKAITELSVWGVDDLGGIEHLVNLKRLDASDSPFTDISPIAKLKKLTWLDARDTRVTDLRPVAGHPTLENLSVTSAIELPTIATSATQASPLRKPNGAALKLSSSTAVTAADGKSWRLPRAGSHTIHFTSIDWDNQDEYSWIYFTGTITQHSTGPAQFAKAATPKVTGDVFVGGTVTVDTGTWDKGAKLTYQWAAGGKNIAGATSKNFRPTSAQLRKTLTVAVTGTKDGIQRLTKTSKPTGKLMKGAKPKLKGTPAFGKTMKVATGTWTKGAKLTYRWYGDNLPIPGAKKSSYKVTSSEQGKKVHVVVTAKLSGYQTVVTSTSKSKRMTLLNTASKASVKAAYKKILAPAEKVQPGWTGKVSGCKVGTESAKSKKATLNAINFVRALNQLDGVYLNSTLNKKALRSSLIQQANNRLDHMPSKKLKCWTKDGYDAASTGNLSWGAVSGRAATGYMLDDGAWNTAVGHRRWLMQPQTRIMGTGSTSLANTIVVVDRDGKYSSKYNARPQWMEWPSKGWFPSQLEPWGRWSLSESNRDVDFSKAKVTVTTGGKKLKVKTYRPEPGSGPNTLVWEVSGVKPPAGKKTKSYTVKVTGIKGAKSSSYTYRVKMFDPTAK